MKNRVATATLGRRVVWAAITLGLLAVATAQIVPNSSPTHPRVRAELAQAYRFGSGCLSPDATQEELDAFLAEQATTAGYSPRSVEAVYGDNEIWSYTIGGSTRLVDLEDTSANNYGAGAIVRYSFPSPSSGLSGLYPRFAVKGIPRDRGLEFIRQGLAAWSCSSGIHIYEVEDPDTTLAIDPDPNGASDVRIWGNNNGTGVLGFANFPWRGGDIWLITNLSTDLSTQLSDRLLRSDNNYRTLRNITTHEFGHAIGFYHPAGIFGSRMMEGILPDEFDSLSFHEKRAVGRCYGDRYTNRVAGAMPNWTAANAVDFDDLTTRSVFEPDLSTNGSGTPAGEDWFKFTINDTRFVTITVNPTGGSDWFIQSSPGNPDRVPPKVRHGERAGDLAFSLSGSGVNQTINAGGLGATETYSASLAPGTYLLRVYDVGPNNADDMIVQLYDLAIRVGDWRVPPRAVAGIDKRVEAQTDCYFMGQFHSRALEAGAKIVAYEWDPGEGGTISSTTGEVHYEYATPGTRTARLRVQDSFGTWSDWDEIKVDVY